MERALAAELLAAALDGQQHMATPDELRQLLADAEVGLFLRQPRLPVQLLDTAWFLHGIASVDGAHQRYTIARQRRAFAVSAHIFDLALTDERWSRADRLALGFAAAIGYRRSELEPNAAGILRRLQADISVDDPVAGHLATLAVEAGVALLGFQTQTLFSWLRRWRRQLRDLAQLANLPDLSTTGYGTTDAVVRGAEHLVQYLTRGRPNRLDLAVAELTRAALGQAGTGEHTARWVAAHLIDLAADASAGSVFTLLPPDLPDTARQAFTLAPPQVLTLWRPQRDLLTATRSPFDPTTRRTVLSVPTSGGKTLLAQLLTVAHLARETSSVCYIAPTRSLCREVRRAMAGRVRILQKEIGSEAPDFPLSADLLDQLGDDSPPDVEVMTPERLFHLLRHDAQAVLNRFGLFLFDEAQLVQEPGRGLTLETLISYLHYRTVDTDHRLVLISAALGNQGQIMQWIDPTGEGVLHQSDWRGPRRLHAVFSTDADWNNETITKSRSKQTPYRMTYPLHGQIRLRPAEGQTVRLRTTQPIGTLTLKASQPDQHVGRAPDPTRSSKQFELASQMIQLTGHAGTVLVVAGQRATAERLARQLASSLPINPATAAVADLARLQLGDAHPLVDCLRRGVGFHHAGLPTEVLEAMEDALRDDQLPYLTCTSTLTDGVNLPVRTVVLYDEPHLPNGRLTGARLVNAMGRAGRAGKETEGWIILARPAAPQDSDFADLRPTADDLAARSTLVNPEALAQLSELEAAAHANVDAIFNAAAGVAADFVSFIWFALAADEAANPPVTTDIDRLIDATLAGRQADMPARRSLRALADTVRTVYTRTPATARHRWARAGTSVGSARRLDAIADQVVAHIVGHAPWLEPLSNPATLIDLLDELGVLQLLLDLPENTSRWRFTTKPRGQTQVRVDPKRLLQGWLAATSLSDLADDLLAEVDDPAWRISQLVDVVTGHFEHFLSWTLGALVELVNGTLADRELEPVCPDLGGYVRYGVSNSNALALLLAGVRSRRLAQAIAEQIPPDLGPAETRDRLADMTLTEWRERFRASAAEVLDLLAISRTRRGGLLRPILETGVATVGVRLAEDAADPFGIELLAVEPVTITPAADETPPATLGLRRQSDGILVGEVPPSAYADVTAVLDTGLDHVATLDTTHEPPTLTIALTTEPDDDQ